MAAAGSSSYVGVSNTCQSRKTGKSASVHMSKGVSINMLDASHNVEYILYIPKCV